MHTGVLERFLVDLVAVLFGAEFDCGEYHHFTRLQLENGIKTGCEFRLQFMRQEFPVFEGAMVGDNPAKTVGHSAIGGKILFWHRQQVQINIPLHDKTSVNKSGDLCA
jgi:hypothetical protein